MISGLIALCIIAGAIFRPLALPDVGSEAFSVLLFCDEIIIDNHAAVPDAAVTAYTVKATDREYPRLTALWETLRYRRCAHSFVSEWFPETEFIRFVRISRPGFACYFAENAAHAIINGVVYVVISPSDAYQVVAGM